VLESEGHSGSVHGAGDVAALRPAVRTSVLTRPSPKVPTYEYVTRTSENELESTLAAKWSAVEGSKRNGRTR
jgi:hypothetical protein